ncbi:hypothetical protein ACO0LF_05210 [Undibacterium sp. Di27W]|uniref:hypothetical protein n=1 Tax=Undibacterium sp. Di27W TaxID=3413036 RepID=UPI003BEF5996
MNTAVSNVCQHKSHNLIASLFVQTGCSGSIVAGLLGKVCIFSHWQNNKCWRGLPLRYVALQNIVLACFSSQNAVENQWISASKILHFYAHFLSLMHKIGATKNIFKNIFLSSSIFSKSLILKD